jgi:hypothetical protein
LKGRPEKGQRRGEGGIFILLAFSSGPVEGIRLVSLVAFTKEQIVKDVSKVREVRLLASWKAANVTKVGNKRIWEALAKLLGR